MQDVMVGRSTETESRAEAPADAFRKFLMVVDVGFLRPKLERAGVMVR